MFVEFDPRKHKRAFGDGRLYELQDRLEGGKSISHWVKVTDEWVYRNALNNPLFFAVEV